MTTPASAVIAAIEAHLGAPISTLAATTKTAIEAWITAPVISPATLPDGVRGTAYSQTLTAPGAAAPLTWTVTSGSLPAGLTLHAATGVIDGTPTTVASSTFTIRATSASGLTGSQGYTVAVSAPPLVVVGVSKSHDDWSSPQPCAPPAGTLPGDVLFAFCFNSGNVHDHITSPGWAEEYYLNGLYGESGFTVLSLTVPPSPPADWTFSNPYGDQILVLMIGVRGTITTRTWASQLWSTGSPPAPPCAGPAVGPASASGLIMALWVGYQNHLYAAWQAPLVEAERGFTNQPYGVLATARPDPAGVTPTVSGNTSNYDAMIVGLLE